MPMRFTIRRGGPASTATTSCAVDQWSMWEPVPEGSARCWEKESRGTTLHPESVRGIQSSRPSADCGQAPQSRLQQDTHDRCEGARAVCDQRQRRGPTYSVRVIHVLVSTGNVSRKTTRFQRVRSSRNAILGTRIALAEVVALTSVAVVLAVTRSAKLVGASSTPRAAATRIPKVEHGVKVECQSKDSALDGRFADTLGTAVPEIAPHSAMITPGSPAR